MAVYVSMAARFTISGEICSYVCMAGCLTAYGELCSAVRQVRCVRLIVYVSIIDSGWISHCLVTSLTRGLDSSTYHLQMEARHGKILGHPLR